MTPIVMIVDDDLAWLRLVQKELEPFTDTFKVITADNGNSALDMLGKNNIGVVVSDIRMPGMDGYDLLSNILNLYPDIPVYMITAYSKPKTQDVVFKSGASGFLKKPFSAGELAREIMRALNKKAEGGNLHNVSLETYLQLVEMEQQTCTLRITEKKRKKSGVLFFRDGDILNARVGNRQGIKAAYDILSWSSVSLSIENDCVFNEKKIAGDLQAILLDAMRSKDENTPEESVTTEATTSSEILLDTPVAGSENPGAAVIPAPEPQAAPKPAADRVRVKAATPPGKKAPNFGSMTPVEAARAKIADALGNRSGVIDVQTDSRWDGLIYQASGLGDIFELGRFNGIFVNKSADEQYVIIPGNETVIVSLKPESPRDRIINILVE